MALRVRAFVCSLLLALGVDGVEFYPYGPAHDSQLPPQDDVSSPEIYLRVPIRFYDESYSSIFVNSNGVLSFLTEIPMFLSIQFPLNYPLIAPLYANIDISGQGQIYYRESQDADLLLKADERIQQSFPQLETPFESKSLFIATWVEVGYYPRGIDKVNTFQAVVASDGSESFVELLYRNGGVQWIQGGGHTSGLPDAKAQAGFVGEDGRLYTLRGSGTDQIKNLDRWSNTGEPGIWLFRVGNTKSTGNVEPSRGSSVDNDNLIEDNTCQTGAALCHSKADCVDGVDSYCCVCQSGYYGNGRTCLPDDIPLRVNGKLSVGLNGELAKDVDVQAYIVTTDGRSYTALSHVSSTVGKDMQLITSTSDLIGWLFAKSINNAPNGYQLTGGVLNHTAVLTFTNGQQRVTVEQRFFGLDVFDQIRVEGRVFGTVPQVPEGYKLTVPDSQSQFHRTAPGVIQSRTSYIVGVEDSSEKFPVTVYQTISYTEYCNSPSQDTAFRVKAARNFISYEDTEHILRFAATNKISLLSESEDPCVAGHVSCVNNSHCVADGSTFRCACNNGFQTLFSVESSGDYGCVDINECQSGSHSCDADALCINQVGSYTCECRQGFTGNGYTCQPVFLDCTSVSCSPGAECVESEERVPHCYCIPGFTGDGTTCTPNAEDDCLVCSPHAFCNHTQAGDVQCYCLSGYYGDGRNCTLAEDTVIRQCLGLICWCPNGYSASGDICIRDSTAPETPFVKDNTELSQHPQPICFSSSQCSCPRGYVFRDGSCTPVPGANASTHNSKGPSANAFSCNTQFNCHAQAQCIHVPSTGSYECQCNAGFEGNGYDCSETEMSCKDGVEACHQFASCIEDEDTGKSFCWCNDGYQGDGTSCYPKDFCNKNEECGPYGFCTWMEENNRKECECEVGFTMVNKECIKEDLCKSNDVCGENGVCNWLEENERRECECETGYTMKDKICIKEGCKKCHEFAECVNSLAGVPECVCKSGFVGDGVDTCEAEPLGCNVLNNCAIEADCVYDSNEAGYRCQCRQGYEGSGLQCQRVISCLTDPSLCSSNARCLQGPSGYECKCVAGYAGNGQTCSEVRKMEGGFLLVNKGMATIRIPQERTKSNPGRPIQLQYDQIAIGLEVDCVEGLVYWSDISGHVIKKSHLNGKDITVFVDKDVSSPEGLAVDWINRKLYWTDSDKDVIKAADLETGETETVISTGLVNPRGIAVHPTLRKVFWSDWNRAGPKLEFANLDGSSRQVLISQGIQLPNSLAIDWLSQELCWTDAGTKNIDCQHLYTGVRRTVVSNCSYPFGLTITTDKYYWTDWHTQKVESALKYSPTARDSLPVTLGGEGKLFGITAIPDSCPRV